MRHAVLADIHSNWEALMAVMEDSQALGCTRYFCLGDVVGYNANPAECTDYIHRLGCPVVRGNWDEEAASEHQPAPELNPLARHALMWTRRQLTADQKQWLLHLPLVHHTDDFTLVHATLDSPHLWAYVANKFDAMASFSYQTTSLCFYGHTHTPRFYEWTGEVHQIQGGELPLRPGSKYFLNPGSVGQPRDGDWRASYAIYDTADQTVAIRRVEYDIQAAQRKVREAGLLDGSSPE